MNDSLLFNLEEVGLPRTEVPLRDRLKSIEWSYSKRSELEQCPRKYYFDYFGGAIRRAKTEKQKSCIKRLKQLQNRHERAGHILHLVIARYFRSAGTETPLEKSGLVQWAEKLFDSDVILSHKSGRELAEVSGKYPPVQLLEFFHGQPHAEDACHEAREKLIFALQTFARSRKLIKVRSIRGDQSIRIERKFQLRGLACRVTGVVDFAACIKLEPGIIDWKIGASNAGEGDSLQLGVYALWAAQEFACVPEQVRIFKAYLGSDELVRFRCTAESLQDVGQRIRQDALRLLEVADYGNRGKMRAFTACAQSEVCELCRFLTICDEGKEVVGDRNKY